MRRKTIVVDGGAAELATLRARVEELERADEQRVRDISRLTIERDEARDYAFEATKAITGLHGGGSECFAGKLGDRYKADLPFCVQRIREREQRAHDQLLKENQHRKSAEARADRLQSLLDEARKALAALDRMSRGVDWCDQDEQARRWSAARRALEGGE